MPLSTVSGILTRIGMGRLGRLGLEPAERYERARPGELIHVDVKKLDARPGHRVGHQSAGGHHRRVLTGGLQAEPPEPAHPDSREDARDRRERHRERLGDLRAAQAQPPQRRDRLHAPLVGAIGDSRRRRGAIQQPELALDAITPHPLARQRTLTSAASAAIVSVQPCSSTRSHKTRRLLRLNAALACSFIRSPPSEVGRLAAPTSKEARMKPTSSGTTSRARADGTVGPVCRGQRDSCHEAGRNPVIARSDCCHGQTRSSRAAADCALLDGLGASVADLHRREMPATADVAVVRRRARPPPRRCVHQRDRARLRLARVSLLRSARCAPPLEAGVVEQRSRVAAARAAGHCDQF